MSITRFSPGNRRRVQLGSETAEGTAVPANLHLQAIGLDADPQFGVNEIMTSASKYSMGVTIDKEHTKLTLKGEAAYNDLSFWFDSLFHKATYTGGAYVWTPSSYNQDDYRSYTAEIGDNVNNLSIPGCNADSLTLTFSPTGKVAMGGSMLGLLLDDYDGTGTPLTTATDVPLCPLLPKRNGVYVSDTLAGLDAAPVLGDLTTVWGITNARELVWTNDPSTDTASGTVDGEPKMTGSFVIPAGNGLRAYMTDARAGNAKWLRVTNAVTIGGVAYALQIDQAINFSANPGARGVNQHVYAGTFPWVARTASELGGPCRITVTTDMTSIGS